MIIDRAVLKIDESEYDILRMSYGFYRRTDAKGRPATGVRGGDIFVQIESESANPLLEKMLQKEVLPMAGSIEVTTNEAGQLLRCIEFEKAYIYSYGEETVSASCQPVLTTIAISPVRLDVGDQVRLDRRWLETAGFCWQQYKQEEVKRTQVVAPEENSTPILTRVYFKNDQGEEIGEVLENGVVTICAEVEDARLGDVVRFVLAYNDGTEKQVSGTVNGSGVVEIPGYELG